MSHEKLFRTGYMDNALDPEGLNEIVTKAMKELADVDFDTIVGTGFSGGVVIPYLAASMGKNFVLIRKEGDDSHHGPGRLLGTLGKRWIFVDDFISTGATARRVKDKIAEGCAEQAGVVWNPATLKYDDDGQPAFETVYVGDYTYINFDKPGWRPGGWEQE